MERCTDQRSVFSSRFWNPQRFPCNIIQVRIIPAASHQFYKPLKVIFHLQTEYWPCCVLGKAAPGTVWFTSGLLSNASHFPSCLSEKPSCPPQHRWWWHLCCWNKTRSQFSIPLESNCCRRQVWGRVKKKEKFGFLFWEQMVKSFLLKMAHLNLLNCCSLARPTGPLPQVPFRKSGHWGYMGASLNLDTNYIWMFFSEWRL